MSAQDTIQTLLKALEAGMPSGAPGSLSQGAALQIENLSSKMEVVTYENKHLKLQGMIGKEDCKSTLAQFDRQLGYGIFGGAAQFEGFAGQEETSDFVRITVPMAFYSHVRRVTIASTMVATVDGKKSDERAASDAAIKIAGDIEFDLMRGLDDFSNAGVFDGHPLVVPSLPNMHGLALQIRQSDSQQNSHDRMFSEYGSDDTVVLSAGGLPLKQDIVEDASVRSAINFGNAKKLLVDPIALSAYNKLTFGKERIILAGSPQDATGGDLSRQWVSGGTVNIEASQFLRGKSKPAAPRSHSKAPGAPTFTSAVTTTTAALAPGVYTYYVTCGNEIGESGASPSGTATTVNVGDQVALTITPNGGSVGPSRYFNVYRSAPGGTAATARFIGRVANSGSSTTAFVDLGNKVPGFVTGLLIDPEGITMMELAPYSRMKLAQSDLSLPEAHFEFTTLAVKQPRKSVLVDSILGQHS